MSLTSLRILHILSHLIFHYDIFYYPNFTDEETGAQGSYVICPGSPSTLDFGAESLNHHAIYYFPQERTDF